MPYVPVGIKEFKKRRILILRIGLEQHPIRADVRSFEMFLEATKGTVVKYNTGPISMEQIKIRASPNTLTYLVIYLNFCHK